MDREQKEAAVAELSESLKDAEAIFAIDYRGISVTEAAELRGKLRDADAVFKVVKNRLAQRAVADAGTDGIADLLVGPTALTLIKGDAVIAAKAIADFAKSHPELEYKGGFMDGAVLEPEGFQTIARLPGLDALRAQLVMLTASPLTGLATGMSNLISGLGRQLAQMADQGLVSGEAPATPAADEEAPAEPEAQPATEAQATSQETEPRDSEAEAPQEIEDAADGAPEAPATAPETESEDEASEEVEAEAGETPADNEEA